MALSSKELGVNSVDSTLPRRQIKIEKLFVRQVKVMIRPGSDKNVKDKPSKIGCHGASSGLHKNREGGENILSGNPH